MPDILIPTSYLPPISYFVELLKHNTITIEKHEHYVKQSYRNRCCIYGANGMLSLVIPVQKGNGEHTKIKDVKINYDTNWKKVHWKSLESAYRTSPYFEYYEHLFEGLYVNNTPTFLLDFNQNLLEIVLSILKINPAILFTEEYIKSPMNCFDLRAVSPKSKKEFQLTRYMQVFEPKFGFIKNLSIVDLIFNLGPKSLQYLEENR